MCTADEPEHTRESECVRCSAGATVGLLILAMGRLLARLRRGDSRAPATLMAALYAEDWAQVGAGMGLLGVAAARRRAPSGGPVANYCSHDDRNHQ
jgi:hypothetical protein